MPWVKRDYDVLTLHAPRSTLYAPTLSAPDFTCQR
jgi:hypothetical protein